MTTRTAACSCGQLRATMTGKPAFVSACSCRDCQRRGGSVFGVSAFWPNAAVAAIAGESRVWRRISDSRRWIDNHFCPTCGNTLYWHAEALPGLIGVGAGNFADPSFDAPTHAVWTESKHPWVKFPEGCVENLRQ
jgi:hypothetical protein